MQALFLPPDPVPCPTLRHLGAAAVGLASKDDLGHIAISFGQLKCSFFNDVISHGQRLYFLCVSHAELVKMNRSATMGGQDTRREVVMKSNAACHRQVASYSRALGPFLRDGCV